MQFVRWVTGVLGESPLNVCFFHEICLSLFVTFIFYISFALIKANKTCINCKI